jgi:peptidoglycan/xylan/chitin deacetylase (PgdA/CDA1 family)
MNQIQKMFWLLVSMCVIGFGISGCSAPAKRISGTPRGEPEPRVETFTPVPPFTLTLAPSETSTLLPTLTQTQSPTWTQTPTSTPTPSPTPTATWIFTEAGRVVAPILLYHHIADVTPTNRYYVSPANFHEQMKALKDWGFTTITPSYLRQVLVNGGDLPDRPVIISFDDGDMDVYDNAYPIMLEYGFIGAFYIVSSRLGADGYVGIDQLKDMVSKGWEIGSHTINHIDLTQNHDYVRDEMLQSRLDIEDALSVTVTSIAYPYGLVDEYVATKAQEYGYFTGMGLGILTEHTWGTLYYLNRREVHGDMDLDKFAGLLPWSDTPVPFSPVVTATAQMP